MTVSLKLNSTYVQLCRKKKNDKKRNLQVLSKMRYQQRQIYKLCTKDKKTQERYKCAQDEKIIRK